MVDKYIAVFDVAHGVSHGFGFIDYDDVIQERLEIEADSDKTAFQRVYEHAKSLAKNYLADTSGYKKVTLQSLMDNSGREIDQVGLLRANAPKDAPIEDVLRMMLPEGRLFIKRHWTADLAEMALSE